MDVEEYKKLKDAIAVDVVMLAVKSGLTVKTVLLNVEEETREIVRDVLQP